jgi:hypothetical protein
LLSKLVFGKIYESIILLQQVKCIRLYVMFCQRNTAAGYSIVYNFLAP